jgi:transcription elongation factor Elf1
MLSNDDIEISCPNCNNEIKVKIAQIEKEAVIHCNRCERDIKLKTENIETKRTIQKANKAYNDFEKSIKDINIAF